MKDIIQELRTILHNLTATGLMLNGGLHPQDAAARIEANCARLSKAIDVIEKPPCPYGCYQGNLYGKDPEQGPDKACPHCEEEVAVRTRYHSMRGMQEELLNGERFDVS